MTAEDREREKQKAREDIVYHGAFGICQDTTYIQSSTPTSFIPYTIHQHYKSMQPIDQSAHFNHSQMQNNLEKYLKSSET